MLRATELRSAGHWPQRQARGTATLDFDARHRRRITLKSDAGEPFLLDLPRTEVLHEGDGLALSDGTWLEVKAAAEPLLEGRATTPALLMRLAWHLGNRHLPTAIEADRLLIRDDHVIAEMLRGLGATLRPIEAPFTPEGGAYSTGTDHHHHHRDHDHHS
jgi:urease accessory protein